MTPERLGHLFDRHAGALELFAAQWVRQPEDPVQEAFIELSRQAEEPRNVTAWLYTVTRNRAISLARSRNRRTVHEARAGSMANRLSTTPETRLDAHTAAEALCRLPDEEREIVVARIWGGLGFEAIAEVVGLSKSTVHRRYESAIHTLRRRLGLQWLTKETSDGPAPATSSRC